MQFPIPDFWTVALSDGDHSNVLVILWPAIDSAKIMALEMVSFSDVYSSVRASDQFPSNASWCSLVHLLATLW
jgi:hypothetical protein